ncbi:MAG: thiamine pyrophosphate-binding protein [Endomicrobiaceae bacterium]|nr:thiamine pyrophosphate-binding protein [Endomicrobiaceae bacterium]
MIKLSDYIAKRLKQVYKVKNVFMVSGGGAMHLNNSFGKYIKYICNHHEQACAFSAEGYARVNQNLAVVNVTTGPGGLNCLNGVFGQWTDSVPVLYISGQVKYSTTVSSCRDIKLRQLGDQEVDIVNVVKPLTKYAVMVTDPNEIKYHLDKAIYEATHGRFGPVWLDIPMNVQAAFIDEKKLKSFKPPEIKNNKPNIQKIIDKIKKAQRPLLVAGHGIRLSSQIKLFDKIVEKLKIPVVTTFNGFDLLESNNKYYIGRIGTIGQRAGNFALQNADLILFLGTRNNIRQISYNWEKFATKAFKIVVDIDNNELIKPLLKPDLAINCDLKDFLLKFFKSIQNISVTKYFDWLTFCQKLKKKYCFKNYCECGQKSNIINPYSFTYSLTKNLKETDILVSANGYASICVFQNAVIKKNQRFILNSGNASMGFGLPASIGASLSSNGQNVICLEGDGSIMMNIQELQTIKHNNLPVKIFVINNNGYASIRQTQTNFFNGEMVGCDKKSGVSVPDFVKIGQSFGLKTKRINNPKKMEQEIKKILSYKEPVLCEVIVDSNQQIQPRVISKKLKNGFMISMPIENMYPFLSKKEMEENIIK